MNEKLTEQYYRCDFETSKLLKEAGFDLPTTAFYQWPDYKLCYHEHNITRNGTSTCISAPLISVAKEWCYEKGYAHEVDGVKGFEIYDKTENLIGIYPQHYASKETDIHFIQTCCKHIIENK